MNNPVMSICIPAYNQSNLVRDCLARIVAYEGDDIEIVVNDDCSSEDLQEVVNNLNDDRIKYYRNSINLGHDLNILQSFRNSKSKYAFLLRSRDCLVPNAIGAIIKRIKENTEMSYLTGSAIDEDGKARLVYRKNLRYSKGKEALDAHKWLYVHPSGSLYAIHLLDFDRIERFLENQFTHKYGFVIHTIIRLELALRGNFEIMSNFIWQYTHTVRATDTAVNSAENKESVYSPRLSLERFNAEMKWANLVVPDRYKTDVFKTITKLYLMMVTWEFKLINEEPSMHRHYNTKKMNFSIKEERSNFYNLAKAFSMEYIVNPVVKRGYVRNLDIQILKNSIFCFSRSIRHFLVKILKKSDRIAVLLSKIKLICKRKDRV